MNDDYKNQLEDFFTSKSPKERRSLFSRIKSSVGEKLKGIFPTRKQLIFLPDTLSRKERYLFIGFSLIIIISILYIPISLYYRSTKEVADFGGKYREGVIGEPRYINPLLAQISDADRDLSSIIFSGLMKYDDKGNLVPDLAESYKISNDGLIYTFFLKDIYWHDGEIFSADDIVFTMTTAQNPAYNSPQIINWQGIEVEAIDDKTIQFTLKSNYAQFINNTTLGILPQHVWKDVKPINFSLSELNLKPIGSGPYKFKKFKKDSLGRIKNYKLVAFKDFYDGKPYINSIEMNFYTSEDEMIQAYNRNEIQGLTFISPMKNNEVKFQKRLNIRSLLVPRYFAIFFNQNQSKTLSSKNVRLALSYGTDRKEFISQILNERGQEVYSPILPEILNIGEPTKKYEFNPDFAQEILENSNWTKNDGKIRENKDGEKLSIKLTTSNWPELMRAAELIKSQWENIGVSVELEILSISELQQVIKGREYEALLFGEVLNINPDPFSFWHSSQRKDPGLNLALYNNKTVDKLLEEARQTIDSIERAQKYDDFQKVLLEDAPAVFLYSPYYIYAPNKKIKNMNIKIIAIPSNRFDNINTWYIDTKRVKK